MAFRMEGSAELLKSLPKGDADRKKTSCRLQRRVDEELQEMGANHIKLRNFPQPEVVDTTKTIRKCKHPDLFQLALVHLLVANTGDRRPKTTEKPLLGGRNLQQTPAGMCWVTRGWMHVFQRECLMLGK